MFYYDALRNEIEFFKNSDDEKKYWKRWAFGAITYAVDVNLITEQQQQDLYRDFDIL